MRKTILGIAGVLSALLLTGLVSAHGTQNSDWNNSWENSHQEMAKLHEQLDNGEITSEEFWSSMQEEMEELMGTEGCPMMRATRGQHGMRMMGMH